MGKGEQLSFLIEILGKKRNLEMNPNFVLWCDFGYFRPRKKNLVRKYAYIRLISQIERLLIVLICHH